MRVKYYIALLLLATVVAAAAFSIMVAAGMRNLELQAAQSGEASEEYQRVLSFKENSSQFLTVMDILTTEEAFGVFTIADDVRKRCQSDLKMLENSSLFHGTDLAGDVSKSFAALIVAAKNASLAGLSGSDSVKEASREEPTPPQESMTDTLSDGADQEFSLDDIVPPSQEPDSAPPTKTNHRDEAMGRYNDAADGFLVFRDRFESHASITAQAQMAEVDRLKWRFLSIVIVVALLVLGLIGGLYRLTTTKLVKPVQGLAAAAENAMLHDEPFTLSETGPQEVRSLTRSFSSFVGSLESKVSERTQALQESEERNRLIVDTALDGVITVDSEGLIAGWNPQAHFIFGWPREEVIGKRFVELVVPPSDRETREKELNERRTIRQDAADNQLVRWTGRHRQGHEFPMELAISSVRLSGEHVVSAFVRDITDRESFERELQKAKHVADDANKAKGDFLANMSHEIRTPMNGIIGMVNLALDTELTAEQKEYLDTVSQSADSLLSIINDILDFSKIEARKIVLESTEFDLRDHIAETTRAHALRAHEKGLELVWDVDADVPDGLVGDPLRLRQILVNLIGNALKFTDQGEVLLQVDKESETDNNVLLHFVVKDTGIGIPEAKQKGLFEAFSQADASTTRKYGGTGLGLAISSELSQKMEGRMWVESEVGEGSKFHFTARFEVQAGDGKGEIEQEILALNGLRVLIVDDNATNRQILNQLVNNWRMTPTSVESGDSALAAIEAATNSGGKFDVLLTDYQMPQMDGFMLCERIRRNRELSSLKIILLTSGLRVEDREQITELSIAATLMKPVKPSQLLETIRTVVTGGDAGLLAAPADTDRARPPTRSLRLLVAEDNKVNQILALRLLEKWGHSVTIANNGLEALDTVGAQEFDLVLMDVQMPEMDGLEATEAIRATEKDSKTHIPIIAMTAHAMAEDRQRCLDAGMDAYVSKPIDSDSLYDAILGVMPEAENALTEETVSPSTEPLVDWDAALAGHHGNRSLLAEVVTILLDEWSTTMAQLQSAVEDKNGESVEHAAHALKGSVAYLYSTPVSEAVERLETMGRENAIGPFSDAYRDLEETMVRLKPELKTFIRDNTE
jgi:PAS domain S-box-containing protein